MKPEELLRLAIKYAPDARAVGIKSVTIEGLSFELGELQAAPEDIKDDDEEHFDVLDDPATFGIRSKRKPGDRKKDES